jgi:hypothetical protein
MSDFLPLAAPPAPALAGRPITRAGLASRAERHGADARECNSAFDANEPLLLDLS